MFRQFLILALILPCFAYSQASRTPASYIPDDDKIIVPTSYEKTFYEQVTERNKGYLESHRRGIQQWIYMDEFVRNYGLEDAGFYNTSSPQQRRKYFERHYIRYFTKKVGRGAGRNIKEWWNEWSTDDEIDAIESNINREGYIIKSTSSSSTLRRLSKGQEFDVKVSIKKRKHRWKIRFQPRLEQGSIKFKVSYDDFYAHAFLGANGRQEVFMEKGSLNLKLMVIFIVKFILSIK